MITRWQVNYDLTVSRVDYTAIDPKDIHAELQLGLFKYHTHVDGKLQGYAIEPDGFVKKRDAIFVQFTMLREELERLNEIYKAVVTELAMF